MVLLSAGLLSSCGEYNNVLKSTDYEYKYEAAKAYFAKGQNSKAAPKDRIVRLLLFWKNLFL